MLLGAVVAEVAATLCLKAALEQSVWYFVVVAGYLSAFVLLAQAMRRGLPLGVAYGIWASLGVALTALLSHLLFGEPLTAIMIAGLGLIVIGVLFIELGSHRAARNSTASTLVEELA